MNVKYKLSEANEIIIDRKINSSLDINSEIQKKKINISNEFIKGKSLIHYSSGFCIIYNNYEILKPIHEFYSIDKEHIQISIAITSGSQIKLESLLKSIPEGILQIVYRERKETTVFLKPNASFSYIRFFFSKEYFLALIKNEYFKDKDFLYENVKNGLSVNFGTIVIPLQFNLLKIIYEIQENTYKGKNEHFYLQNKFKELLLLLHFSSLESNDIHNSDRQKILQAKEYLDRNYNKITSIKELSKIVFLNEFKLKKGFKEFVGKSIHNYEISLKMKMSLIILENKKSVNETSFILGYRNPSHFINTFKKYYGYTPRKFLNNKTID
ncbi:AraC family transcriptional regulator [Chishuiella sp.]|uniref:helix-turn-helix transcriptional regulator n=1 Tax=Chishuiella sp. TaxID=1969467 RepID=UPI0028B0F14F|nr:AraC family transcriptional regulator [Chishuiella sp.]